jgi:hypothetical protein
MLVASPQKAIGPAALYSGTRMRFRLLFARIGLDAVVARPVAQLPASSQLLPA